MAHIKAMDKIENNIVPFGMIDLNHGNGLRPDGKFTTPSGKI